MRLGGELQSARAVTEEYLSIKTQVVLIMDSLIIQEFATDRIHVSYTYFLFCVC